MSNVCTLFVMVGISGVDGFPTSRDSRMAEDAEDIMIMPEFYLIIYDDDIGFDVTTLSYRAPR